MAFTLIHTKTDGTSGDHWSIDHLSLRRDVAVAYLHLYKDAQAKLEGKEPMLIIPVNIELVNVDSEKESILKESVQTWILANEAQFLGGVGV